MQWLGLPLAQVLGVLAAAGTAVVVLYLLKLRRRQVHVPFVRLWREVVADNQSTRLFSTLKRILSLLVALAIVALLGTALGDPRRADATSGGRTLLLVIDASASMQATDVAPSRLEVARRQALRLVASLGPGDRALVAQMDATTTPLSPLTSDTGLLRDAIAAVRPTEVKADLARAVLLAVDVLRGQPSPEMVVISDGRVESSEGADRALAGRHVRVSWVRVGRGGSRNVAITAFSLRRHPLDKSRTEALVELRNTGPRDESVELRLLSGGETIDVQRLAVRKGERLRRFFEGVAGADRALEARISLADGTHDALGADDHAWAALAQRRRARVLSVSRGNRYLEAALLLDEYLDVTEITPEQYPAPGRFDVVILDDFVPATPPTVSTLWLHPAPGPGVTGPLAVTGTLTRPFFDSLDRRHPLLAFTALANVNVAEALAVRLEPGDRAVAADRRGPLVVAGTRSGHRIVAVTFDVRQSDLPLRVAWPLLVLNAIDWFVEEDTAYVSSYRTGEPWYVRAPAGATRAEVVGPDGGRRAVPIVDGRAVLTGTRAGLYRLVTPVGEAVFAANLGAVSESELDPPRTLAIGGAPAGRVSEGDAALGRELWIYLVLAAALVLALEWLSYHRRWTV